MTDVESLSKACHDKFTPSLSPQPSLAPPPPPPPPPPPYSLLPSPNGRASTSHGLVRSILKRRPLQKTGSFLFKVFSLVPFLFMVAILGTLVGTLSMLIGNGILRSSHHPNHTSDNLAAAIGAVGGPIIFVPFTCLMLLISVLWDWDGMLLLAMFLGCCMGGPVSAVGYEVLRTWKPLGDSDFDGMYFVGDAAMAGAAGAPIAVPKCCHRAQVEPDNENIDINVQNGRLTVSAETKQSEEHDENGYAVRERRFGKYSRTLQLPQGVKDEEIKASKENGLLTITFPKSAPELAPKKITIS
ncbi:hypothetical protein D9613_010964 [Agrocybe pediades]|uniref:SHSP domain-containing protein n=1 Tax=Agrocybe pediades TaxID=84607 RepID=A0A8H4QMY3_9AGAR|nr:hypothetical protein D9613_010964 [Agrocybe pediades]